ncbi:MAG TPA: hypothetical protein VMM12_10420 [Longimicrobiales bacterium]|nr:hypothetical protein [Longimicrobiales bacterium]
MRPSFPRPARRTLLAVLAALLVLAGAAIAYVLSITTPLERVAAAEAVPPAGSPDFIRLIELTDRTFGRRGRWERVRERMAVLASRVL